MKLISLKIENYKGINSQTIRFDKCSEPNIISLVGLNESGKTTTLEAIERFAMGETLEGNPIVPQGFGFNNADKPGSMIPKHLLSNFSDSVRFTAEVKLEAPHVKMIIDKFNVYANSAENRESKLAVDVKKIDTGSSFLIERSFKFSDSNFEESSLSDLPISFKRDGKNCSPDEEGKLKDIFTKLLLSLMPSINFFPAALSEFPEKIYLEETKDETKINRCYREIIGDILAVDDMNIKDHIVARVVGKETDALESVKNKIKSRIQRDVVRQWGQIFGTESIGRTVDISIQNDDDERCYLKISLCQGEETFAIKDTSLGHRWFFCFLMFTIFRKNRLGDDKQVVFLLDEPAANLHPTAQSKMLETFKRITDEKCMLIYTTHSPYMVEPDWLENTFIVRNETERSEEDIGSATVDINITPYRQMLTEDEEQSAYMKIIFDALDYSLPKIDMLNHKPKVIVEGKGDYCVYEYFRNIIFKNRHNIQFVPGTGASKLAPIASILTSWGQNYMVLCDSDREGRQSLQDIDEMFLPQTNNIGLKEIDDNFSDLESLIMSDVRQLIGPSPRKKQIRKFFQEKLAVRERIDLSDESETKKNFEKVFDYLQDKSGVDG